MGTSAGALALRQASAWQFSSVGRLSGAARASGPGIAHRTVTSSGAAAQARSIAGRKVSGNTGAPVGASPAALVRLASRSAFKDFAEPGFGKTVYALGTRGLEDGRTLLWATMRTATTDEHARAWFQLYWTFGVGYGAHVLVHGLLDSVREEAERRASGRGG